jgi:hypothetical protein
MPTGASQQPTAWSLVNPKIIPNKFIKISFIFTFPVYMMCNVIGGHRMPAGASRRPTAQSFVNPKTIPRKLIKISFIFVCINYMIWNVNGGHWTPAGTSRWADGAVVCKSQKNSKEIAKNIVYFCIPRLHDIKCNWGSSDAYGRVTTERKADGAGVL